MAGVDFRRATHPTTEASATVVRWLLPNRPQPNGRRFARLAVLEYRSSPGAYATRRGEVADRHVGALPARNSPPRLIFENISLPLSGPRLTSNSHAAQFDNLTKRGNASCMH